jgi:hypothetical protein
MAGLLAVGAHLAAQLCGEKGEPILLGVLVFLVGTHVACRFPSYDILYYSCAFFLCHNFVHAYMVAPQHLQRPSHGSSRR